ncbi:hypothetical protein HN680_00205, partial [Candidatus Peregrinibacteria bacterium]|nr:hypothetical protein [Candidatus Peregrinibacteria bacterium]
ELASTRIGREQAEAEALFERAERFAADLKTALEAALQEVHGDGVGGVINVEVMIDRKTGELVTYITDNQDASRRMIFKWRLSAIPEDYTEDNVNELAIKFAEHDTEGSSRGTQDFIVDTISLHQAAREADKAVLLERAEEMAAELKPALEARMREAYGPSILDHVRIEVVVNSEDMNIQARVYVIDSQDPNNFVWINAPIEALIESSTTIESSTHSIVNAPEINGFIVRTIEQREQAAAARLDEAEAARSAAEQSALESERNATLHADKLSSLREFGSQSIEDPSLNPDQKEAVQASIYMFSITAADYIRGGEEPGQALSDARDAIQNSQQYFKALDPASKAVVIGAIGSYIYISGTSQEGLAPDVEGALETLAGQAEAEIRKQMVERYGEDVFDLFVPHVEVNTEEEPPTLVLTYEDLFNGTTDLRIEGPATGAEPQALAAAALDTSKGQVQYIESIISNRERARTQIQENGADFLQFELDALEGHEGVCKYAKIDIKPEQISIVPSGINSKWLISVDYSFTNLATQSEIYLRQPFEVFSWGTGVAHKKFAKAVAKGIGSEAPEYKEQNKFLRKAIRQGKAAERREELTGSLDLGHKAQEKIWKDVKSFIENPAAINAKYLELLREERAKGSREGELDRSDYTSLYNDALMKMLESRGYEANGIGYPKFVVRVGRQEFQFKCSVNTPRIGADDGLLIDSGPDPRRGDGPKYIDFTMYDRLGSPLSRKTSLRRML